MLRPNLRLYATYQMYPIPYYIVGAGPTLCIGS